MPKSKLVNGVSKKLNELNEDEQKQYEKELLQQQFQNLSAWNAKYNFEIDNGNKKSQSNASTDDEDSYYSPNGHQRHQNRPEQQQREQMQQEQHHLKQQRKSKYADEDKSVLEEEEIIPFSGQNEQNTGKSWFSLCNLFQPTKCEEEIWEDFDFSQIPFSNIKE